MRRILEGTLLLAARPGRRDLLGARRRYGWGEQIDYTDDPNRIGWTRLGDAEHPGAMAVLLSDGPGGTKWMNVARPDVRFVDLTEHVRDPVRSNADGWGEFRCNGGSVSVWVQDPHPAGG